MSHKGNDYFIDLAKEKIEQPERFETPAWVKYFIDFICSKDQKEWTEYKNYNHDLELPEDDTF